MQLVSVASYHVMSHISGHIADVAQHKQEISITNGVLWSSSLIIMQHVGSPQSVAIP